MAKIIKARSEGNQFIAIQHTAPRIQFGVDLSQSWHSPFHVFWGSFPWKRCKSSFAIGVDRSWRPFRGFLPRKTTPRDLYQATVIVKLLKMAIVSSAC